MAEVTFYLPLPADFTGPVLESLAESLADTPLRLDGAADSLQVGVVTGAVVEGDRVVCTAKVDDDFVFGRVAGVPVSLRQHRTLGPYVNVENRVR